MMLTSAVARIGCRQRISSVSRCKQPCTLLVDAAAATFVHSFSVLQVCIDSRRSGGEGRMAPGDIPGLVRIGSLRKTSYADSGRAAGVQHLDAYYSCGACRPTQPFIPSGSVMMTSFG